jgi:hypothetical protein
MLRMIAGIVTGYLVFAVPSFLLFRVTHVDPHAAATKTFEIIAIVCGIFFAVLGGYIGTAIGRKNWLSLTIAAIIAAGAISSMVATGMSWSPIAAVICMMPAAVVGGWLWRRQHEPSEGGA